MLVLSTGRKNTNLDLQWSILTIASMRFWRCPCISSVWCAKVNLNGSFTDPIKSKTWKVTLSYERRHRNSRSLMRGDPDLRTHLIKSVNPLCQIALQGKSLNSKLLAISIKIKPHSVNHLAHKARSDSSTQLARLSNNKSPHERSLSLDTNAKLQKTKTQKMKHNW